MEKLKIRFVILLCVVIFSSCDEMNSLHQPYLDEGEITYRAKPDSIAVSSGNERVKIQWILSIDSKITKTVIEYNNRETVIEVGIKRTNPVDTFDVIIDKLAEGDYKFEIRNEDDRGNSSLVVNEFASIYGEAYRSGLTARIVKKLVATADSATIYWGRPKEGETGLELEYQNTNQKKVVVYVPKEISETVIYGQQSQGELKYRSFYLPQKNAIDTFATDTVTFVIPES